MSDSSNVLSFGVLVRNRDLIGSKRDQFISEISSLAESRVYDEIIIVQACSQCDIKRLIEESFPHPRTPIIVVESSRNVKVWAYARLFAEQAVGDFVVWMHEFDYESAMQLSAHNFDSSLMWLTRRHYHNDYYRFNRRYKHSVVDERAVGYIASRHALNVALSNDNQDHDLLISLGLAFPDSDLLQIDSVASNSDNYVEDIFYTWSEMNRLIVRHCSPYLPYVLRPVFIGFVLVMMLNASVFLTTTVALAILVTYVLAIVMNVLYDIVELLRINIAYSSGKKVSGTAIVEVVK